MSVIYCPDCKGVGGKNESDGGDYLCEPCDWEVHRHKKRLDHVRTVTPIITIAIAQHRISGFLRYIRDRKVLVATCRRVIERYYDPRTRRYFYFNSNTQEVSWHLPICLRNQILKPLPTFEVCCRRIQGLVRLKLARNLLVRMIVASYDKIFSRNEVRFYYFYTGKSALVPITSWKKPLFLAKKDLKPIRTRDVCALLLQGQWFSYLSRKFMRSLIRQHFKRGVDPLSGQYFYTNTITGTVAWHKPLLLGKERWDPDDMSAWDVYETCLFLRRLGSNLAPSPAPLDRHREDGLHPPLNKYKRLVAIFEKFEIDGQLLLTFEWEDYQAIGITMNHQIKKILLEIEKKPFFAKYEDSPSALVSRERLRYHHKVEVAAMYIQRAYRGRYGRIMYQRFQDLARLSYSEAVRKKALAEASVWYTQRYNEVVEPKTKRWGRRKLILSAQGWGSWKGDKWVPAEGPDADDAHRSREHAVKLEKVLPRMDLSTRGLMFQDMLAHHQKHH